MPVKRTDNKFSLRERAHSFSFAFSGLFTLIREEPNALIHLLVLILVIIAGIVFGISGADWIAIAIVSGMVIASECFNTSIENLSDFVTPGKDDRIKRVKDLAASGVLVSAIIAVIVGMFIFIPELVRLFK